MQTATLSGLLVFGLLAVSPHASAEVFGNLWFPDDNGTLIDVAIQNDCPEASGVPIPDGQTQLWVADTPAAGNHDFGADPFYYSLILESGFLGMVTLYVGSATGASVFTPFGSAVLIGDGSSLSYSGTFSVLAPQIVPQGDYLAFQLVNDDDDTGGTARRIIVATGCEASYFASGASDPGYPTPELMTLALVGSGALVIGAVALRRRR